MAQIASIQPVNTDFYAVYDSLKPDQRLEAGNYVIASYMEELIDFECPEGTGEGGTRIYPTVGQLFPLGEQ